MENLKRYNQELDRIETELKQAGKLASDKEVQEVRKETNHLITNNQ